MRAAAQPDDGVILFCVDFAAGAKRQPHQLKLTGMMDHTAQIYGNFTGCEMNDT